MSSRKCVLVFLCILALSGCQVLPKGSPAAPGKDNWKPFVPETATDTESIRTAVQGGMRWILNTAHFHNYGRQIFAVWYCPYSGRDTSHLHAYYLDHEGKKWIRFASTAIHGSHNLSVEITASRQLLVFRNTKGEAVLKYSVEHLPPKEIKGKNRNAEPSAALDGPAPRSARALSVGFMEIDE